MSTHAAIEAICENVVGARFERLGARPVEAAKHRLIDLVGCAVGGANAPGNRPLVDLVRQWGGKKEATLLVHGGRVPAANAAMVNAIVARSFDFEAMSIVVEGEWIPSHHAATTVMTALSLGEARAVSGKELLTALVVGDDVNARVLAAGGWDFGLGWDGTMTLPIFGATPVAGRLLGLDAHQLKHAFGIALNLVAGAIQSIWDGAATFKLGQGTSARNGIFAAELAKAGWTGVDDALLSRFGYYFLYGKGHCERPEILTQHLGERFYTEETFKSYPCGWPNHGPIQCALEIVKKHRPEPSEIEEVTVGLTKRNMGIYYAQPFRLREFPHADAIFSYQYTVATALLKGAVKLEHFTEEAIRAPDVNDLVARTRCAEVPGATGRAVELRVRLKDGRELVEATDTWKGDPLKDPLTAEEIVEKFWEQVDFSKTVGRRKAAKALDLIRNLEQVDDVGRLVRLVTG